MDLLTVETLERPAGDDEVRALLPGLGADRALLGGGTWLFSVPQPHLRGLVDLTAVGWSSPTSIRPRTPRGPRCRCSRRVARRSSGRARSGTSRPSAATSASPCPPDR
jgi:hypothetical protein